MKIRKPTPDIRSKVYGLLNSAFSKSKYQAAPVEQFHDNKKAIHEWVCIHIKKGIAYIAFFNAYNDKNNKHFLAIRNSTTTRFIIGYEPEFGPIR